MSQTQPQTNAVETVLDHAETDASPEDAGIAEVSEALLQDIDDIGEGDLSTEVVGRAIGEALGRELGARLGSELGEWLALRIRDAVTGGDEAGSLTEMVRSWVRALKEWLQTLGGALPGVGDSEGALPAAGEVEDVIPVSGGPAESDEESADDQQAVVDRVQESFDVSAEEAAAIVRGDESAEGGSSEESESDESASGGSEADELRSDAESVVEEADDGSEAQDTGASDGGDAEGGDETETGDGVAADEGTVDEAVSAESDAGAVEEEIEADAQGSIEESAEEAEEAMEGSEEGTDASDDGDADADEDGGPTRNEVSDRLVDMSEDDLEGLAQDLVDELKQRQEGTA